MGRPVISLLTDFGLRDGYVASMKGVILSICPQAVLVDISHDVEPQCVRSAAFLLASTCPYFPPGTIHLVVVDPGVGTSRKALAIQTPDSWLVGPDNGVFSWALRKTDRFEARSVENDAYRRTPVSATFHGRDIFAPAAAHLANGVPLSAFGPLCTPMRSDWATARMEESGALRGEVMHLDRFGNAITNITSTDLERLAARPDLLNIRAGTRTIGALSRTYSDRQAGEVVALTGSSGYLEIAVNLGNCAKTLGLQVGDPIEVTRGVSYG